jgi:hypothetical protein
MALGTAARAAASPAADAKPLEATIARYEHEIGLLKSHEALEKLQGALGYYIDKGLWRQAAALFTADATFEFGQRGVYAGRAHIIKAMTLVYGPEGLLQGQLNNYPMLQPIIDVAPDNRTAVARWRSDVELATGGKGRWGEGEYENEYVNDHGVWKIRKLHYYITVVADYDKGWVDGAIPMEPPSKEIPPDRPPTEVYGSLPEVYLPAYHYKNPVTGTPAPPSLDPDPLPAGAPADLAAVSSELAAVGRRIEHLRDQNALEKVQRAYGYYVDKAQWHDVADLFQQHGTLEIGGRGVFLGKARVLEYMLKAFGTPGPKKGSIINHQQFQGIVDVAPDGRTAKGRWTAFVMGGTVWGDVTYENEYVKEDGIWKISKLHAPFNMYAQYKDGWELSAVPHTRPDSFDPPPDLPPSVVSLTYPSFYVTPYHYPNPVTGRPMPPPNPAAGGVAPMSDYP